MDEALAAMVANHRAIVASLGHDVRHAPTDSIQIVLLAAILDALTANAPPKPQKSNS